MLLRSFLPGVAALLIAGPAFGHAKLLRTVPAADAQLRTTPTSLTLSFNENVRLAVLSLTSGSKTIPLTVDRNLPATPEVSVPLPALAAGKYQVRWSALSPDDGHITKGMFSFVILDATAGAVDPPKPR
jgi:methionine-rich copper-binding protein CopC